MTGRLRAKAHKGRSSIVDGHKWGGDAFVSLAIVGMKDDAAFTKTDAITVVGKLNVVNGTFQSVSKFINRGYLITLLFLSSFSHYLRLIVRY